MLFWFEGADRTVSFTDKPEHYDLKCNYFERIIILDNYLRVSESSASLYVWPWSMFAFPPLFYANTSLYRQEEKAKMEGGEEDRRSCGNGGRERRRRRRRRWLRL